MGNGLTGCLARRAHRRRHDTAAVVSEPFCYDEGLGHSFFYARPEPIRVSTSQVLHEDVITTAAKGRPESTTFRSISGASVSANTSTNPLSDYSSQLFFPIPSVFDCSDSFSSVPLQHIPPFASGPLTGVLERGFLSGPLVDTDRFLSGPIHPISGICSGPLELKKHNRRQFLGRSFSYGDSRRSSFIRGMKRAVSRSITSVPDSIVKSLRKQSDPVDTVTIETVSTTGGENSIGAGGKNLHWAQGKAGEDRLHVVVSEEYGWVFVGIYDGFNGPDAPDYLLSGLYSAVEKELKVLLCEDTKSDKNRGNDPIPDISPLDCNSKMPTPESQENTDIEKNITSGATRKWEESRRSWGSEWDRKLDEQVLNFTVDVSFDHAKILQAMSKALKHTEEKYLDVADRNVSENPELALMGSCVLAMLMKEDDVYLMNVGDSRAVLGRKSGPGIWVGVGNDCRDLERINEENPYDKTVDADDGFSRLISLQLTSDHSTCVEEEVNRIRKEHSDDASAVTNDRVKGSLKVTRAFGAGFLKQPKWNDALLEIFKIDYVGKSPYITCNPSLRHHKLSPGDRFLILSSDGLYQYFTNEEAVAEAELFITAYPEADPAKHLVEELLIRAAKKAGMELSELLEIPQGGRRRYHDDVSIVVISLEGRIWRSCT